MQRVAASRCHACRCRSTSTARAAEASLALRLGTARGRRSVTGPLKIVAPSALRVAMTESCATRPGSPAVRAFSRYVAGREPSFAIVIDWPTGTPIRSRRASISWGDAQPPVTTLPCVNDAPKTLGLLSAASTEGTTTSVASAARSETKIFRSMLSSSSRSAAPSLPAGESVVSPIRVGLATHQVAAEECSPGARARQGRPRSGRPHRCR